MPIREYHERDLQAVRAIHAAQGFDYALPDLRNPLFITKLVLTDGAPPSPGNAGLPIGAVSELQANAQQGGSAAAEQGSSFTTQQGTSAVAQQGSSFAAQQPTGKILGAAFLRLTAEGYLLLDPQAGAPHDRWRALLSLHAAAEQDAWRRGLKDVHAWLPPPIAKKFGHRLARLGWQRDDTWTPYCRKLSISP